MLMHFAYSSSSTTGQSPRSQEFRVYFFPKVDKDGGGDYQEASITLNKSGWSAACKA